MNFLLVDGDWPVATYVLPRQQLLAHAVKNNDIGDERASLVIQGRALLALCQQLLDSFLWKTRTPPNLATLGLILLRDLHGEPLSALRLVTPKSVSHDVFPLEDLLGPERLVVLTSRLESLGVVAALAGVKTTRRPHNDLENASKPRLEASGRRKNHGNSVIPDAVMAGRNRSVLRKFTRAETYFTSMTSAMSADLNMVNQLLLDGTIRMDSRMQSYLCSVCGSLPQQTLTTSCCGAVVCTHCAPMPLLPPSSVLSERIVCMVCGEIPLTEPEAHLGRDVDVMRLVRELRVLYHPQLTAAACHAITDKSQSVVPFSDDHAGLNAGPLHDTCNTTAPVLGSIFPTP